MGNFLDYLDWRGDLSLTRDPFNEVDNLILAQLAYTDFQGIVPTPEEESFITLREAAERYENEGRDQSFLSNDPAPLLKKAAASERFGGTRLSAFVNEVDADEQLQFSALCFTLDDGSVYVAFRGTDNTIVGWREDFNLCFLSETPGQCRATRYLNGAAARYDGMLRVGGHSKGGNLAFYAAAFCDSEVKGRLLAVYSNDGPGFRTEVTQRALYREVFHKLKKIVPETSIIGLLLTSSEEPKVIKSSADGIQQHNPYSWQVERDHFARAEKLSTFSSLLEDALDRWVDTLSDEERYSLVSAIFDSLDAAGVKTFTELNANRGASYMAILRAARGLDPVLQREVMEIAKKLAGASKDVLWDEVKKSFTELVTA